jgi:hypothetical protein
MIRPVDLALPRAAPGQAAYPTQRYTSGLSDLMIANNAGTLVKTPLFFDNFPAASSEGLRARGFGLLAWIDGSGKKRARRGPSVGRKLLTLLNARPQTSFTERAHLVWQGAIQCLDFCLVLHVYSV